MEGIPTIDDIREAAKRIAPHANRTPVLRSTTFDDRFGAALFFKGENFQKVGAFKFRGACNAVFSLSEAQAEKGVVTHSSGNHAQALSLAAKKRGIPAWIVMPENAPAVKVEAVRGYGGRIRFCKPTLEARETTAEEVIRETGAVLIHPYNDPRIIAGQGTATLELLEEVPDLDLVLAPVGGGGLLGGTLLTCASLAPKVRVVAAEPEAADDAYRSWKAGKILPSVNPQTVADGLRTSLGSLTFPILQKHVHAVVTVSEPAIVKAMRDTWERMKIVIEPSAAVPLAALAEGTVDAKGKRVGLILSGGNVSLDALPWA
ncbi:MAG: pyridoxal-phosphate dependent enzyme [Planctomycetota bacterium]|jgi:threonine dehydratase